MSESEKELPGRVSSRRVYTGRVVSLDVDTVRFPDSSVGELEMAAPTGLGLSCQTSAAAVEAAHGEVAAFTAGLASRIGERATGVVEDNTSYLAQDAACGVAFLHGNLLLDQPSRLNVGKDLLQHHLWMQQYRERLVVIISSLHAKY